jgi:hypothetical protein
MFDINQENLRRKLEADRADIAAFLWEVRRVPEHMVDGAQVDSEIIIAEYDNAGILHRFNEIKVQPPYLFCAKSERTGVPSRYVHIEPGWEFIWHHRVRTSVCMVGQDNPAYVPPITEDCVLLGRRHLFLLKEEVILIYPSGQFVGPFDSLMKALQY